MKTELTDDTRRNRVDPWGDLHALAFRGMFTGNRGCLVDEAGQLVRHHAGSLWIICQTSYRDWRHPLEAPRTWTPLFFLDDGVALAAGHRPCGLCRRADYLAYQQGVTASLNRTKPVLALELNRHLAAERLRRGRGLRRAADRILTTNRLVDLPNGAIVLHPETNAASLVLDGRLRNYAMDRWGPAEHATAWRHSPSNTHTDHITRRPTPWLHPNTPRERVTVWGPAFCSTCSWMATASNSIPTVRCICF